MRLRTSQSVASELNTYACPARYTDRVGRSVAAHAGRCDAN